MCIDSREGCVKQWGIGNWTCTGMFTDRLSTDGICLSCNGRYLF